MNEMGYIHSGGSLEGAADVVSWHDLGETRAWVHSRATKGGREIFSVEIQLIEENAPKPTKSELSARLKLHASRNLPTLSKGFTAAFIRSVPIGSVFDDHAQALSHIINKSLKQTKIHLVSESSIKSSSDFENFRWDTKEEILWEGSRSKDAIVIAKIYAILQASGARKLSARTAKLLGVDVSVVHTAVQVARRHGWLTSNGTGIPGGVLTEEGERHFIASKGPERLAKIMKLIEKR